MRRTLMTVTMLLGVWFVPGAQATSATWTNTVNGTSDVWTTPANWNAANYPGADGAYQNAFLTNRVSGSVYKAVVNGNLPNALGTVEIRNNGGSGGEAWVIVTNATVTITNLLVRTQGRLEIDNLGVVTNATVTMDGTNGQILVNSGGSLFSVTNIYVGGNAAGTAFGTNNSLTIGDGGVVGSLCSPIIGSGSSYNTLYVPGNNVMIRTTNGAPTIGSASAVGNRMVFTGSNIVWDCGASQVRIGQQINAGHTTNNVWLVSGGSLMLTNHGTFNVGFGVGTGPDTSGNSLIVTNAGRLYTKSTVGVGYVGSSNAAIVTGAGSLRDGGGAKEQSGANVGVSNLIVVDQGGTLTNCYIYVGDASPLAYGNSLLVTNNSRLFTTGSPTVVGNWGTNNTAMITGTGTVWNQGGQSIYIGYVNKTTNAFSTVRIDNGATLTNGGFYVGNGAANGITLGNTLIVTNGAQVFGQVGGSGGSYMVGNLCASNLAVFSGPTTLWNCNTQSLTVGTGTSASGNVLRIESGAVVTNGGSPSIGAAGGVGNMLIVTNGGQYSVAGGQSAFIGSNSTNNMVLVTGNNAQFSAPGAALYCSLSIGSGNAASNVMVVDNGGACPGWATVSVGRTTNCVGNMLIITNGGYLQANAVYANYRGTNIWSNTVVVVNGGVLECGSTLGTDQNGDVTPLNGNNSITNSGGVYQFTTVTPTITPVPAHNSLIYLDSGTIAYRALSTVNVKGNLPGSNGTALTNITYAANGHNGFRLNSATNVTSPDQSYTFATGLGATNYTRLELINGSQYRGGTVTIGNGGTLAMWGAPSTITNLTIGANGTLEVTLNGTGSTNLLTAVGSVTLGGSLNVILAGPPPPAGWSTTLINKTSPGALTGRFGNGPLRASYLGTNYAFSATYSSSTLVLNSQGKVTTGTVLLFQ